jgi:hypothetical protein
MPVCFIEAPPGIRPEAKKRMLRDEGWHKRARHVSAPKETRVRLGDGQLLIRSGHSREAG